MYSFIFINQLDIDHSENLNYPFFGGANGSGAVGLGAVDRTQKTQDGRLLDTSL
jgi:hypothetical protein